jgi:hypothetical protein
MTAREVALACLLHRDPVVETEITEEPLLPPPSLLAVQARELVILENPEVSTTHLGCVQRRELRLRSLDRDLGQPFGTVDVLEPVQAKIAERHPFWQVVLDELTRRGREQDLPAMTHCAYPRGTVHRESDIPLARRRRLAGVEADPHADS